MQLSPRSRPPETRAARRTRQLLLLQSELITESNALEQRHVVHHVLAFAAADGYLFAGCVSQLWREGWLEAEKEQESDGAESIEVTSGDGAEDGGAAISAEERKLPRSTSLSAVAQSVSRVTWALGSGLKWSSRLSATAARLGRGLDVLKYGRRSRHLRFGGEPRNVDRLLTAAAAAGHLETLEWARVSGSDWSQSEDLILEAAASGQLRVVKWARANGCPWAPDGYRTWVLSYAMRGGHFDLVKWLWENGCPRPSGPEIADSAAESGHLEMLQWLVARGYSWDQWTYIAAAGYGRLDMIQWGRANSFPWGADSDLDACGAAAEGGHLEVLQWLRANGCPWGEYTCENVSDNSDSHGRRQEVLDWLHANGCPCEHTGIPFD